MFSPSGNGVVVPKAVTFLPFLMSWTRTHLRIACSTALVEMSVGKSELKSSNIVVIILRRGIDVRSWAAWLRRRPSRERYPWRGTNHRTGCFPPPLVATVDVDSGFFFSFGSCAPGLEGSAESTLLVGQIGPPLLAAVVAQLARSVKATGLSTRHFCCETAMLVE